MKNAYRHWHYFKGGAQTYSRSHAPRGNALGNAPAFRDAGASLYGLLASLFGKEELGKICYKNKAFDTSMFHFYKIPLNPPFPKGEVKDRTLLQSPKPASHNRKLEFLMMIEQWN